MSMHPSSQLDEVSTDALLAELALRLGRIEAGLCDYCEKLREPPACRFPDRHAIPLEKCDPEDVSAFARTPRGLSAHLTFDSRRFVVEMESTTLDAARFRALVVVLGGEA